MNSDPLAAYQIPGGNYGYTGTRIEDLQSNENTIVLGLLDESLSTEKFGPDMEKAMGEVIKSLRDCPRVDNLIYRHCHFSTTFREVHGFKQLSKINEKDYDGVYHSHGCTTLYDSCERAIKELTHYAEEQGKLQYLCNGLFYIFTDGQDQGSTLTQAAVKKALADAISSEKLESLVTILIGVNPNKDIQNELKAFAANVGFSQYVPLDNADQKTLSKLANFISRSVSSQSKMLGSGGPSQSLTF